MVGTEGLVTSSAISACISVGAPALCARKADPRIADSRMVYAPVPLARGVKRSRLYAAIDIRRKTKSLR